VERYQSETGGVQTVQKCGFEHGYQRQQRAVASKHEPIAVTCKTNKAEDELCAAQCFQLRPCTKEVGLGTLVGRY
jgi:hypothetical protein